MAVARASSETEDTASRFDEREIRRLSIDTIRGLAMDAVQKANSGHPGTAMALAPLAYTLFERFLRVNPQDTAWPDRDRFVLSAGHACVLQYSLLHLTGYDLGLEDLKQFRQWGSRTPGHPERGHTPGIEVTTGPLGQGFGNAVGMAIAERFLAERFNRPGHEIVDHHVYAICSDGDLMEGSARRPPRSPATSASASWSSATTTTTSRSTARPRSPSTARTTRARFEADGWHVQRVEDSEDVDALEAAIAAARDETERPSFIAIRSHIAYPAPQRRRHRQGARLGRWARRRCAPTKQVMGFDPDRKFWVDERVYEHMSLRESGAAASREWQASLRSVARGLPRDGRRLGSRLGRAPARRLARGAAELRGRRADRDALGRAEGDGRASPSSRPTMIGGAADLVESTKTVFEGAGEFSQVHAGRNVPFGIREHAMGAIVNGAAAHGGIVKPYGSTFLIFSDYMRPAVRLSALMGLPVVWVWTHDSVGPRRGRPDPPAGRALCGAARDPPPVGDPPGRRQRDRRRLAASRWSARTAPSRCCSRARTSRCSTAARSPPPRASSAAATCCGTPRRRRRRPRADPDRHRRRGRADARRRRGRSPRRARGCASSRCPAWSCSKPSRRSTATRCCPAPCAPAWRSSPGATHELVEVGGQRRRRARPRPLRRLGAGHHRAREAGLHRREHRARAHAALLESRD